MKETRKPPRGARPRPVKPSGGLRAWRADAADGAKAERSQRQDGKDLAGLSARQLAVELIEAVLVSSRSLDDALEAADGNPQFRRLEPRDRGFARLIAATVLRRKGSLEAVLARFLERPLPASAPRPRSILLAGAAQVLMIGTPVHAAINLAVEQCRRDKAAERFDKLTNAVLRRVASQGPAILDELDTPRIDIPDWLWTKWVEAYGEAGATRIANASLAEAPLDLTVKSDGQAWAERLGGELLATGSVRLKDAGRVEDLEGFKDGAWWVQDAAAALPARLLGDVAGLDVADLCAAPGGKSAELASAGARVTAIDLSAERLARLEANVARLGLGERVEVVVADLLAYETDRAFDAVLLDAPCLATGTIRRHPDLMHLKRPSDLERIVALQGRLLDRAGALVKPGGRLVYCVCSIEPEEGEHVVKAFLEAHPEFERKPVVPSEIRGSIDWLTRAGDLRTLPFHEPSPGSPGMDGFYAARLSRRVS
ncbi:MAG: transcription antitermination factor NusB [Hyphomicrobiaceae bacterium]